MGYIIPPPMRITCSPFSPDTLIDPMNKEQRVKIVKQFEQLSLEYDKELRHTVSFAAKICKSPIAMITLADGDMLWIKVKMGTLVKKTPLETSFCKYALKQNHLFVVNDLLADERFRDHADVAGGPRFRFYAAAPLTTRDGHRIGTLCVMDDKTRELNDEQRLSLRILAKHAMSVMEHKLTLDKLDKTFTDLKRVKEHKSKNDIKLRSMFESLTDSYFLLGKEQEIIDFNRTAFDFIKEKYNINLTYGDRMTDFLPPSYKECFTLHYRNALRGQKMQIEKLAAYGAMGKVWWDCVFEPVKNNAGAIIGVSHVARDITDRKLNEEKIMEQNSLLSRISQIQSHDYRGPVASILGLMNLIEEEDYVAPKEYLMMMQVAVKRLDEKIHEVVNIVNDPLISYPLPVN